LLQMISLQFSATSELQHLRFLRTHRSTIVSEATVADSLRKNFYRLLHYHPNLLITQIISDKQNLPLLSSDFYLVS
jgi:DNA-binding LytR/AlgR family response regulator